MKLDLSIAFDNNKAKAYFDKLMDSKSKIELKEFKPKRTVSQNKYLHVCFTIVANETGYTVEEAKTVLKREHGAFMVYEKEGNKFLRSTATLDTLEMTMFIDWLRRFAMDHGYYIPTPEEFLQSQFEIEKELQYIK